MRGCYQTRIKSLPLAELRVAARQIAEIYMQIGQAEHRLLFLEALVRVRGLVAFLADVENLLEQDIAHQRTELIGAGQTRQSVIPRLLQRGINRILPAYGALQRTTAVDDGGRVIHPQHLLRRPRYIGKMPEARLCLQKIKVAAQFHGVTGMSVCLILYHIPPA